MISKLTDIHNHLLPAVDDGSRSLVETFHYLRRFGEQDVARVVFTPHLLVHQMGDPEMEVVLMAHRDHFEAVVEALGHTEGIPELYLGQEIFASTREDARRVAARDDLGLADGGTLLVELGFLEGFDGDGVVEELMDAGRDVVLAHPERYAYGAADPVSTVRRWREGGARTQVNAGSLLGFYTPRAREVAHRLLIAGLVDMVASDHHGDSRPHDPRLAAMVLETAVGAEAAELLLCTNPNRVRIGAAPVPVPFVPSRAKPAPSRQRPGPTAPSWLSAPGP